MGLPNTTKNVKPAEICVVICANTTNVFANDKIQRIMQGININWTVSNRSGDPTVDESLGLVPWIGASP